MKNTLQTVLEKNPDLRKNIAYNHIYSDITVAVFWKLGKEKASALNYQLVKNTGANKDIPDLKLIDKHGAIVAYFDIEQDFSGMFSNFTGKFRYKSLHVPIEKKSRFNLTAPTYYIKVSKELSNLVMIDGNYAKKIWTKIQIPCWHANKRILRDFYDVEIKMLKGKNKFIQSVVSNWFESFMKIYNSYGEK